MRHEDQHLMHDATLGHGNLVLRFAAIAVILGCGLSGQPSTQQQYPAAHVFAHVDAGQAEEQAQTF
jgi:hypothetical protein